MKKLICLVVFSLFLSTNIVSANAKIPSKFDNLILGLMDEPISDAVIDYYKDDTARFQYHWSKNHDVVEVDQSEKGNNLKAMFVVKIHIQAENNNNTLGVDTLTFGVTPGATGKNNKETKIKLLSYDHSNPIGNKE
ncbi:DUF3888 domain-containing protein [Lederbergia graminis]|uniref:DUF3888 domain-containing protein n=1 Tax=Lederbergia graminis TaxID=735518 RepID=A0ABW0LKC6_9BACI